MYILPKGALNIEEAQAELSLAILLSTFVPGPAHEQTLGVRPGQKMNVNPTTEQGKGEYETLTWALGSNAAQLQTGTSGLGHWRLKQASRGQHTSPIRLYILELARGKTLLIWPDAGGRAGCSCAALLLDVERRERGGWRSAIAEDEVAEGGLHS